MKKNKPRIKVIGVGGSGSNAITRMAKCRIPGVELIVMNTDAQNLKYASADLKIQLGKKVTQGLGTGMNFKLGREAAKESKEEVTGILKGSDMVFITCGLGGGTGTGASPIVADIAVQEGILTVAVVTRPFSFEGAFRNNIAKAGLRKLRERVDSLISISNDKLLSTLDPNTSLISAFWACDDILRQAVQEISDLILLPGIINVDFADVKAVLKNSGTALFGIGTAKGSKRAEEASLRAINSPLLDISYKGAKGILFNISGGKDISLSEIDEIAKVITREINSEAKVIFGAVQSEKLNKGEIKVAIIATGF